LAAAAAAAAAASASARVFAGPAVADGAVTGAATPEAAGVPGTTGVSGDAANPL
jgi:hypothetical protein